MAADIAAALCLQRSPVTAALCNSRRHRRYRCSPPVTAALLAAPHSMQRPPPPLPFVFCDGRRLCRRPFPLCPLGATAPVCPRTAARPVLRPAFVVDIELPHR
jgi:hypothetical protein